MALHVGTGVGEGCGSVVVRELDYRPNTPLWIAQELAKKNKNCWLLLNFTST